MRLKVKRDPVVLIVVGVLVAGMLLFSVYKTRRSAQFTAVPAPKAASQSAHDFALKTIDGKTVHLSDFKGKAVLLNFWATWCEPCKIETPWLVELQKQYGSQGLQIVGVDMQDDASVEEVSSFAKDMGIGYPILVGKPSEQDAIADAYGGIPFLPETFLIGRDGKIVGKILGLRSKSDIEDEIKKALTAAPAAQARRALFPASLLPSSLVQGISC
jgi:cytochrome c biogenesis protein CcmG/thiol:disulfide interchange protein DsbE